MTLGTIFESVLGPSSSPGTGHSHKLLSERNSAFYHDGSSNGHRKRSKSEKKQAILSALTLLAFLFFLNILQNCIREQSGDRGTVMMFGGTGGSAPTGQQAKEPGEESNGGEGPPRRKRDGGWVQRNDTGHGRKSRSLLGVEEAAGRGDRREEKFIKDFRAGNNWTRELSQMSERDLEDQKLKTLNFPLYWKNNRLRATTTPRAAENKVRNETVSQVLRRFRKRERTSSSTEPPQSESKAPAWDYKRPDNFQPSPYIPENHTRDSHRNQTRNNHWQTRRQVTPPPHITLDTPAIAPHVSTTPRNRRSDHSTITPTDYDDYDRYPDPANDDLRLSPTSAVGLDLNTFQTFPVYNYYNHRPTPLRDNQTADAPAPEPTPHDIDRMHNHLLRLTTQQPLFHPTNTSPPHPKPSLHTNTHPPQHPPRHPSRPPPQHPHYHLTNHRPSHRYTYSPFRKTAAYDPSHLHDDYYPPPVLLAKYELQHDEPGFDLINFFWTMLTSFAKPLTNLVPTFAKDNGQDVQCYDLLLCEAHRASRFMGPTAEALATTLGTLFTWAATEETRHLLLNAINSARENTCQQQIRDCEERSGGKSAMTMLAQVMEIKLP